MSTILACHQTFFATDLKVSAMKSGSFCMGDFAASDFLVDSAVLIGQTTIHLGSTRM